MRVCLNIKRLKGKITATQQGVRLIFKIGEELTIESEVGTLDFGKYSFMQKHYFDYSAAINAPYVEIQLADFSGVLLERITVFYSKFKQFNSIQIKGSNAQCTLEYEIKEESCNIQTSLTLKTEEDGLIESKGELQIFRLGVMLIKFAQRLDIVVYIYHKLVYFITWRDPLITLFGTIVLSIMLFYLKTSILIAGVMLYFGKNKLIKRFERVHRYDNIKERILFPQQNALFLQMIMEIYCDTFQKVSGVLFSHDKTFLVNVITFVCKMSFLYALFLFVFDSILITILGIWVIIALNSPIKKQIFPHVKMFAISFASEYFKITDKISSKINGVIKGSLSEPKTQTQRQFYVYQYEYWSVFQGWLKEIKQFSDQDQESMITPKLIAPIGWGWITDWKIDYDCEGDEQGYQYRGNIFENYSSNSTLAVKRRRRWKRTCVRLLDV